MDDAGPTRDWGHAAKWMFIGMLLLGAFLGGVALFVNALAFSPRKLTEMRQQWDRRVLVEYLELGDATPTRWCPRSGTVAGWYRPQIP